MELNNLDHQVFFYAACFCNVFCVFSEQNNTKNSFFHLPFPSLFALSGPECSRNFTSKSGVIKSPGYPEKYPNNLDCTFMIFAPKMSEIVLEFESFELEPDSQSPAGVYCRFDRLEIWDGFPGGKRL